MEGPVARAEPATDATPVRASRAVSVGLAISGPRMLTHDLALPLPSVRVGVNLSPRLALDLTVGALPYDATGRRTMIDLGARWFFSDHHTSPYAMVRAGDFFSNAQEGAAHGRSYPLVTVGAGIEYACGCGFVAWAEAGPALFRYTDGVSSSAAGGLYLSLGAGYRIAVP